MADAPLPVGLLKHLDSDTKFRLIEMLAKYNPELLRTGDWENFVVRESRPMFDHYTDKDATYEDPSVGLTDMRSGDVQISTLTDSIPRTSAHESLHRTLMDNSMDDGMRNDHYWMALLMPEIWKSPDIAEEYADPLNYPTYSLNMLDRQRANTQEIYDRAQSHVLTGVPHNKPTAYQSGARYVNDYEMDRDPENWRPGAIERALRWLGLA